MPEIKISTNKKLLDINFIHVSISNTFWGKGRTLETTKTCIENSLNFGLYINKKQIAYARVVTDYAVFAYMMDVFVDEKYRGRGYSKDLIKFILENKALKKIKIWRLTTSDAHALYEKFGFKKMEKQENIMELKQ